MNLRRREFLKLAGSFLIAPSLAAWGGCGCKGKFDDYQFPISIHRLSQQRGHHLLGLLGGPQRHEHIDTVIVGTGIAALTCAWKLSKCGFHDYCLIDFEDQIGGNCRCATYPESRAPWAAHYLPTPTREAASTIELLEDLKLIKGYSAAGEPIYDELQLGHDPHERLFQQGRWYEGFFPSATDENDQKQLDEFRKTIEDYAKQRDSQGRPPFTIPLCYSSQEARELDSMTMTEYMNRRGWTSYRLRWYVEYGCRDDYGTSLSTTSAWAALNYFIGRHTNRTGPEDGLFTWPEGNAWFAEHILALAQAPVRLSTLVYRIEEDKHEVRADCLDFATGTVTRLHAKHVIYAGPTFLRRWIIPGEPQYKLFTYCPWVTANLTLKHLPKEQVGFPICWDNVIYDSPSLGYVVDTHQSLSQKPNQPTVITWYRAYAEDAHIKRTRWKLLHRSKESYKQEILSDLSVPHPDLPSLVTRMDIMLLGHAMIRPIPGLIWGDERQRAQRQRERILFAHSDLSGISWFEEAQYHGVKTAELLLKHKGIKHTSSLKPVCS
ncbi:NAD(P)/FAD-dependent oxidoreductase [bacterium]|nr:NAD(P)/FAD-dependent oxidoreductase [bacterium]